MDLFGACGSQAQADVNLFLLNIGTTRQHARVSDAHMNIICQCIHKSLRVHPSEYYRESALHLKLLKILKNLGLYLAKKSQVYSKRRDWKYL